MSKLFDPRQGQWWNAPAEQREQAYYMTLRVHYEMSALDAWNTLKRVRVEHPGLLNDLIGSLRRVLVEKD